MRAPVERGGALPGSEKEEHGMTRDEALTELRRRNGGDLSCVPGPVIMQAIEMMRSGEEDER